MSSSGRDFPAQHRSRHARRIARRSDTEEDDLFGVELIYEDLQIRSQLIRDLVNRMLRVLKHLFPDLRRVN